MQGTYFKSRGLRRLTAPRWIFALWLLGITGICSAQEDTNLVRGEVVFAVNCGRCHINATARFETPPDEMQWLFWPTSPVKAHREIISEQDLQSVLDYLEYRESRAQ
jgi:mono/diheme cytochrome c family protein